MNIIAVDTSTSIVSLALKTDRDYEERLIEGSFSPSENLLGEMKSLLKRRGMRLDELDLLVTTKGPGSFTGLRIALSLLKGISLAADIPVVSIPTLSVIEESVSALWNGPVLSVIDAKKKRFYYRITGTDGKRTEDRDESPEKIASEISSHEGILITGPDASQFYSILMKTDPGAKAKLDETAPHNLSRFLIRLGEEKYLRDGADDIGEGPVYIRRSDAEEMLIEKTAEAGNGN